MATFRESAAHSLDHMFSLYFDYFYFPFWFRGRDFGSDCSGFCILVNFTCTYTKSVQRRMVLVVNFFEFLKLLLEPRHKKTGFLHM